MATIKKAFENIKQDNCVFWNGDGLVEPQGMWVLVLDIPGDEVVDGDSPVVCVDENGMEHECFADEFKDDAQEAPVATVKVLREAAVKALNRRVAAVQKTAEDQNNGQGQDDMDKMRNWLLKQGQFKSCISGIASTIASNAVESFMVGKAPKSNVSEGTDKYAYDWAMRLLGTQFGQQKPQTEQPPVEQPQPEVAPEATVEAKAKTASVKKVAAEELDVAFPNISNIDGELKAIGYTDEGIKGTKMWLAECRDELEQFVDNLEKKDENALRQMAESCKRTAEYCKDEFVAKGAKFGKALESYFFDAANALDDFAKQLK